MSESGHELPTLESPPLIEAVLGVQFAPLANVTSAHFGWYWKAFLDPTWDKVAEAGEIPDQFERFGAMSWQLPIRELKLMDTPTPNRLQIISPEDDQVIQVQRTRFIYNWRKRKSTYPRFNLLLPEFNRQLQRFREFLRTAKLDDIAPNQWEVTYINHVPKGEIWESQEDWHAVFPGLLADPRISMDSVSRQSVSGEWHFEIKPHRGRLHVSCQHAKLADVGQEVLVVQLTARGSIGSNNSDLSLSQGLELGHRVLVRTFFDVCSESALAYWGVKRP